MKKFSMVQTAFGLCLTVCCLAMYSCKQQGRPKMGNNEYKVMQVALSDKMLTSKYSATIRGKQDVEIRPQASGVITEVCVAEGAVVRKGQALFIIDQVPYKAALETAVANVALATANVATAQLTADSKKELFRQNVISAYELQTAENTLKSQQASLAQARAQETNARNDLSYTVVKSPADGSVGMLPYKVGALVNSSIATPLATVSDNTEMYVYFSMTENQILALARQSGTLQNAMLAMPEVQLQLNDGTAYPDKGRVEAISGIIDSSTGAVNLRATFPNKNRVLMSGGSGNVIFPYAKEDCIVVPQGATFETQDKIFVYKVVNGLARAFEINIFTVNDGKEYIVESGLEPGETIVAEGAGLIRNGTEIIPKTEKQHTEISQAK